MTMTQTATVTVPTTKIVKRYKNRKLYDTETSSYMTLRDLAVIVASGREVQVIENVTKLDITGQILLSALVETETDVEMSTATLRSIFQAGGLAKFVQNLKTNG